MEWNGMEWNGMEWNGMEWNGMEWNGMGIIRGSSFTKGFPTMVLTSTILLSSDIVMLNTFSIGCIDSSPHFF